MVENTGMLTVTMCDWKQMIVQQWIVYHNQLTSTDSFDQTQIDNNRHNGCTNLHWLDGIREAHVN